MILILFRAATNISTFLRHKVHLLWTPGFSSQIWSILQCWQWPRLWLLSLLWSLDRWVRKNICVKIIFMLGYNNYSYLGYNSGMTSSAYNSSSLASYGSAVLDPLLQASSLASAASAASAQTTSGKYWSSLQCCGELVCRGLRSTIQWIIKYILPQKYF